MGAKVDMVGGIVTAAGQEWACEVAEQDRDLMFGRCVMSAAHNHKT